MELEYRRILVVEESENIQNLIEHSAARGNYQVIWASDQIEMKLHLQEDAGLGALIISEQMCDDEFSVIHDIKKLNPYIRIIIVAKSWRFDKVRRAMNSGVFDYLTDPVDVDLLAASVDEAIEQSYSRISAAETRKKLLSLQRDLKIAAEVQSHILPRDKGRFDRCNIFARMIPTRKIGGDFYDYFALDDHRVGLVIGDVSGKGIAAALFMAITRSLIKMNALSGVSPAHCLSEVNKALSKENPSLMFATVFYGILDSDTFELIYCNAGHNLPYLIQGDGKIITLEGTGDMALGFDEDVQYQLRKSILDPGDRLFLYTDGVTEAADVKNNMYGNIRLEKIFAESEGREPEWLVNSVLEDVTRFSSGAAQSDDITMLALSLADKESGFTKNKNGQFSFKLQNNMDQLVVLQKNISRFCSRNNLTFAVRHALEITMEELFTNIVNYAFPENGDHQIHYMIRKSGTAIQIEIRDNGQPFDPTKNSVKKPDSYLEDNRVGGWGLQIVQKYMDDMNYRREKNYNILCLTKEIVSP